MTIHEIKNRTLETSPYFFDRQTLKFFRQRMSMFSVKKQPSGKYLISCPMRDSSMRVVGYTQRLFNPLTNELERIQEQVNSVSPV